jgi:hypothetical protein
MRCGAGAFLAAGIFAIAASSGGCSAASTIQQAASGCDEFNGGASSVASLSIDGDTKAFLTASANLVTVAKSLETSVLNACIAIDTDLGVTDTWTAMASMPDSELTEACNQASTAIKGVLSGDAGAQAQCALSISSGYCTVDASVQASCEGSCSGMASCTPPDVTVACMPGELSGECDAMCNASATCEGSVSAQAQCQGSCQADCTGTCTPGTAPTVHCEGTCMGNCNGTCTASGGTGMPSTGACMGTCSGTCDAACMITPGTPAHCDGSCKGTCSGSCKLDATAMINCGAMVNCKGGCSVAYKAPKCEGKITAPMCMASASCQASCQSSAEVQAMCTPPSAKLECSASASAQVTALVTTVQKNLPAILAGFQAQGQLALDAALQVKTTGVALAGNATSLTGKAFACAGVAAEASVKASASVSVSVMASASVSGSCGGPSS